MPEATTNAVPEMVQARFPHHLPASFLDKLRGLDHVIRWNFHPRAHDQSVSEHTCWVGIFTLLLIDIDRHLCRTSISPDVEVEAMRKALLHDWEEAVTGDGPFLLKRQIGRTHWEHAVQFAMNELLRGLPSSLAIRYCDQAIYAKDGPAGRYVAAADLFDVVKYAQDEALRGNSLMYRRIKDEAVFLLREMDWQAVNWLLIQMREGDNLGVGVTDQMTHLGVDEAVHG